MTIARRQFIAGIGTGAVTLAIGSSFAQSPPGRGKRLTLLHLTDTHAQLETHWEYMPGTSPPIVRMGGFARLKTAIDKQRATSQGPAFLVDGGDLVQGSGPAAWSRGEVMIAPANSLGLDAFVPGNWEPVYGPDQFLRLMGQLKTNVIAYNFHHKSTGKRIFEPAVICKRDGVRVAFVGGAQEPPGWS